MPLDTILAVTLQQCGWERPVIEEVLDQVHHTGEARVTMSEIRLDGHTISNADGSPMNIIVRRR